MSSHRQCTSVDAARITSLLIPPSVQPICDSDSTGKHCWSPRMRNDITDMHTVNADSSTDAIWLEKRRSPLQTAPDQVSFSTFSNVLGRKFEGCGCVLASIQRGEFSTYFNAHVRAHFSISPLFSSDNRCLLKRAREYFSFLSVRFQKGGASRSFADDNARSFSIERRRK